MSEPKLSPWLRMVALWWGLGTVVMAGYFEVEVWIVPPPSGWMRAFIAWMMLGFIAAGLKAIYHGITGKDFV